MIVTNHLKEIRKSLGIHQNDLAKTTGFCSKTIGQVEWKKCPPSWKIHAPHGQYFHLMV